MTPVPNRILKWIVPTVLWVLCLTVAGLLLYSSFCSFLYNKFNWDYPRYTNFLWNTAHGRWFHTCSEDNYLRTHLSFSLALFAPVVRIVDHPFTLYVIQWLAILGGGLIAWRTAIRHGVSALGALCLLLFCWGYHFTQTVQLDEFHGVAMYLLLMPWLYHSICYHPRWAWIPLALLLTVQEGAAVMILPLLILLACRMRQRQLYVFLGVTVAYGIAACTAMYFIAKTGAGNNDNLRFFDMARMVRDLSGPGLMPRLSALGWVLLPSLPFLIFRRWALPAVVSLGLLITLASAQPRQYGILFHYSAVVMATMIVGMLESFRKQPADGVPDLSGDLVRRVAPVWLLFATVLSFLFQGQVPGGLNAPRRLTAPAMDRLHVLRVSRQHLPREGCLLTTPAWSNFTANRAELTIWKFWSKTRSPAIDVVMGADADIRQWGFMPELEEGRFGVRYADDAVVILQRGHTTNDNARVIDRIRTARPTEPRRN